MVRDVGSDDRISVVGEGLQQALELLGEVGRELEVRWALMSEADLLASEAEAQRLDVPEAERFDESAAGVRWRAYQRVGEAVRILRHAAERARSAARTEVPAAEAPAPAVADEPQPVAAGAAGG